MRRPSPGLILRTSAPALLLLLGVFVSLVCTAKYAGSFQLVIILWISIPFMLLYIYRKLKGRLGRK